MPGQPSGRAVCDQLDKKIRAIFAASLWVFPKPPAAIYSRKCVDSPQRVLVCLLQDVFACFVVLLVKVHPNWGDAFLGFVPDKKLFDGHGDILYTGIITRAPYSSRVLTKSCSRRNTGCNCHAARPLSGLLSGYPRPNWRIHTCSTSKPGSSAQRPRVSVTRFIPAKRPPPPDGNMHTYYIPEYL